MRSNKSTKLVLDTSAILSGFLSTLSNQGAYVTPLILAEATRKLLGSGNEDLLDLRNLFVMEPSLDSVSRVLKITHNLGETANLSQADLSILALAMELDDKTSAVEVVSDDYSIQNVATKIGIKFRPLSTTGISKLISWKYYCSGCRRCFREVPKKRICPYCGSKIIRKPVRQKSISR
jgi:UPF0271 protein